MNKLIVKKPVVKFIVKSEKNTYENILLFFQNDRDIYQNSSELIANHFEMDINFFKHKSRKSRLDYIKEKVKPFYDKNIKAIENSVINYQEEWDKHQNRIFEEFSTIFNLSYKGSRECLGEININPVCPRFYDDWSFDVSFSDISNVIETTLHELTHFFWFDKWKTVFPDWKRSDFESPSLVWLFSEIAIDAIFKNTWFKKLSSEKPAYDCFYNIEINGLNMLDYLNTLFKKNTIEDFMKKGYEYIKSNKKLIMEKIFKYRMLAEKF